MEARDPRPTPVPARMLNGLAALLALCAAACSTDSTAAEAGLVQYVRDPRFPQAGGFTFQNVSWLTVSPAGDEIYVLQRGTPAVSVWSPQGKLLRTWQTTALGDPHSLRFQSSPGGSTRVWITDMAPPLLAGAGYGHCLKQFTPAGTSLGSIGRCGENSQGTGLDPVQFDKVTDALVDAKGFAWAADGDLGGLNNRVLQMTSDGRVLQAWSAPGNQPGSGPREFNLPHAIDLDACGRVWVADALNHRVQVIKADGTFLQQLQCFGTDGVYGIRVRNSKDGPLLLTTSSPTSSPGGGTVRVFDVSPSCEAPLPVPSGCTTAFQWNIALPPTPSVAMLHMVDASSDSRALYFATLGGNLPPQRWLRVDLPAKP